MLKVKTGGRTFIPCRLVIQPEAGAFSAQAAAIEAGK